MSKQLFACSFMVALAGNLLAEPVVQPITKSSDQLGVLVTVTRIVPVTREVVVNVNGVNQVRKVMVAVPESITQFTPINDKAGTFYDLDGKAIDSKKLPDLIKEGTRVALVYDGQVPNADARKGLVERKAELIVVLKADNKEAPKPPVAQPPVALPPPPPSTPFVIVPAMLKDDLLTFKQAVTAYEQVATKQKRVGPDGKVEEVTVFVMVPVQKEVTVTYAVKDLVFQTVDGKKIDPKELPKLLGDGAKIGLGSIDAPPTPEQLKAAKGIALVVLRKPTLAKAPDKR